MCLDLRGTWAEGQDLHPQEGLELARTSETTVTKGLVLRGNSAHSHNDTRAHDVVRVAFGREWSQHILFLWHEMSRKDKFKRPGSVQE